LDFLEIKSVGDEELQTQ